MPFETPFPQNIFAGTMSAFHHEVEGVPPSTVIRTDQTWHTHVKWETTGIATGMIAGNWHLHAYLESMGPGPEIKLTDPDDHIIPLMPGVSPVQYSHRLEVPAGKVPAGPYKLVVTLTYVEPTGNPGPMAAYDEGPIIQFYEP